MKAALFIWINLAVIFSFLLAGIGLENHQADNTTQEISIYLPMVSNYPPGMAFIPAGDFWMGCTMQPCNFGNIPYHNIYLNDYFIDNYEVTNAQYAKCVADGGCMVPGAFFSHSRTSYYDNPAYANYPVIHITWDEAVDYCQWSGKRLPTEAEWEKAAQGGQNTNFYPFPWGDETPVCDPGAANGAQYDDCSPDDTVQIGSFGPNNFGLYDMAGNAWEWVNDWYDLSYYGISPYYNPQGPESGTDKVIRGGSWNYNWSGLLVFDRNIREPTDPLGWHDVGFRCVFSP